MEELRKGVGFLALIFVRQMTPRQIKPRRRQCRAAAVDGGRRDEFSLLSTLQREKEVAFQSGGPPGVAVGRLEPLVSAIHPLLDRRIVFP